LSYISRPSLPPRLHNTNYSLRWVQITTLLLMQFSPPSRNFISFRPNILLSALFTNTLMYLPRWERQSFTPIQKHRQNYSTYCVF
jgi:hypothetical protein